MKILISLLFLSFSAMSDQVETGKVSFLVNDYENRIDPNSLQRTSLKKANIPNLKLKVCQVRSPFTEEEWINLFTLRFQVEDSLVQKNVLSLKKFEKLYTEYCFHFSPSKYMDQVKMAGHLALEDLYANNPMIQRNFENQSWVKRAKRKYRKIRKKHRLYHVSKHLEVTIAHWSGNKKFSQCECGPEGKAKNRSITTVPPFVPHGYDSGYTSPQ